MQSRCGNVKVRCLLKKGHKGLCENRPSYAGLCTKFINYDARPNPKTDRFCVVCQRDLKPGVQARVVFTMSSEPHCAVHPDEVTQDLRAECDSGLVGMDCARKLGFEWTVQEI